MSGTTRRHRPEVSRSELSDIACLMGLIAITVVFWTLVAFGVVLLF